MQKLLPRLVDVFRDGSVVRLPTDQLVVGDIVALRQGDQIPADCRLIEGFGIRVNCATLTGESAPRSLDTNPSDPSEGADLIHCRNILLAGTSLVSGQAKGVVFATGKLTEFGHIAHIAQTGAEIASPLRKQLAYLSRLIAVLSIAVGALFFAIGALIGVPAWQNVLFFIGIIVAMVPEGLLPTLTLALVLAAQRMAKRNVLIRHLTSVETLGSATVICTDKTGTLTENRMRVREVLLGREHYPALELERRSELAEQYRDFFLVAHLCQDLEEVLEGDAKILLGDPLEMALVQMARAALPDVAIPPRLDEIPFNSDRMRQSVVHDGPAGPTLYCKGAPESVLKLCRWIGGAPDLQPFDATVRRMIVQAQDAMAETGLRVLALALRRLPPSWSHDNLEQDLIFLGLVGLEDPPRAEVPDAIARCRQAGIKVIMVTGDNPHTAIAVGREIGLVTDSAPTVVSGDRLRKLSRVALDLALEAPEVIFARVTSEQKMRIVEALIAKGHVVAVTGDGVNDAPALKTAHIGIAMGIAGTEVAKEAADMILLDDNFASIVSAVEEGRALFQNIRKFLAYVLVHNVAQLVPYLAFMLFKIPLRSRPSRRSPSIWGPTQFPPLAWASSNRIGRSCIYHPEQGESGCLAYRSVCAHISSSAHWKRSLRWRHSSLFCQAVAGHMVN